MRFVGDFTVSLGNFHRNLASDSIGRLNVRSCRNYPGPVGEITGALKVVVNSQLCCVRKLSEFKGGLAGGQFFLNEIGGRLVGGEWIGAVDYFEGIATAITIGIGLWSCSCWSQALRSARFRDGAVFVNDGIADKMKAAPPRA